jgi:hypothetical protein
MFVAVVVVLFSEAAWLRWRCVGRETMMPMTSLLDGRKERRQNSTLSRARDDSGRVLSGYGLQVIFRALKYIYPSQTDECIDGCDGITYQHMDRRIIDVERHYISSQYGIIIIPLRQILTRPCPAFRRKHPLHQVP